MTKEFESDIKDFIYDRLYELKGSSVYASDLPMMLTEEENRNGCWIEHPKVAQEYISKHWTDASDTYDYYITNFGSAIASELNPFGDKACSFTYFMLGYGVDSILYNCNFLQSHYDEDLELTEDTIKIILSDIGI